MAKELLKLQNIYKNFGNVKVLKDVNKNFKKLNLVIIEFHNINKNLKKIRSFINQTKLRNIHINANLMHLNH